VEARLPSTRDLAIAFSASTSTVDGAMATLTELGLIQGLAGGFRWVTGAPPGESTVDIEPLTR
jgi:DNA-binding transcriptional regulator YhcF (GntR family)